MKKIALITGTLLLTISTFGMTDYDVTKHTFTTLASINQLDCRIKVGIQVPVDERTFAVLSQVHMLTDEHSSIDQKHTTATMKGCPIESLDDLVESARTSFGFLDAIITVTKELAKTPKMVAGKCQKLLLESLELDFGTGVVLTTSKIGAYKLATGCNP